MTLGNQARPPQLVVAGDRALGLRGQVMRLVKVAMRGIVIVNKSKALQNDTPVINEKQSIRKVQSCVHVDSRDRH